MITVACLWVRGDVPYSADYVTRLLSMVGRNIDRRFRFVCLTDRPRELPQIETIDIADSRLAGGGLKAWWQKLELFNPARALGPVVLYIDLDSIIVGKLAPLFDFFNDQPEPLCLVPPAGAFRPVGFRTVWRFNSSVMLFNPHHCTALFERFNPAYAKKGNGRALPLWGDQDWIGELMPEASTFPAAWFPRLSDLQAAPAVPEAVIVLCKKPKPHIAARDNDFVAEVWR